MTMLPRRNTWSFDGLVFSELNYSKPGKELPRIPPQPGDDLGRGRIYRPGEETSQFQAFRLTCGIGEMPPYHFGESLSNLIRKRPQGEATRPDLGGESALDDHCARTKGGQYDPRRI